MLFQNGISRGQIAIDKFVCACQRGTDATLCQLLSSGDVHPDATSEEGKTALTLAILQRADNAVRILLQHGADVNKTSHVYYQRDHLSPNMCSYDESPLNTAARLDYSSISKLLIESGAHVNVQSECRLPQGVQTVKDRTALHFSADQGNVEVASYLVKHGAVVNITDKQQETPLHLAVRCRGSIKCGGQREVVSLLLQHGSLPNAANRSSQVPLYLAAFYGCAGKASVLISSGADVNFSCSRDNSLYGYVTALHVAAAKNRVHLAKLLVGHGACMNITNALDYTPLQVNLQTQSKSRVADLLILHGASLSVIDYNGFTLMATLIHNMRLDCELLARLLVCAGYSLNRDLWIQPEHLRENWSTSSKAGTSIWSITVRVPTGN